MSGATASSAPSFQTYESKCDAIVCADADSKARASLCRLSVCVVCQEWPTSALVCNQCDNLVCTGCFTYWQVEINKTNKKKDKTSATCPYCRAPIAAGIDAMSAKLLASIKVQCPDFSYMGCTWVGPFTSVRTHLDTTCDFKTIECEHCSEKACRRDIKAHRLRCPQRPVLCQHCADGPYRPEEMVAHLAECADVVVPCLAYGCSVTCPRGKMQEHNKTCPEMRVWCTTPGCRSMFKRADEAKHEETYMKHHLALLRAALKTYQAAATSVRPSVTDKKTTKAKVAGNKRPSPLGAKMWEDEMRQMNPRSKRAKQKKRRVIDVSDSDGAESDGSYVCDEEEAACTTEPKCPFGGRYKVDHPYGRRCDGCVTARKDRKVVCQLQSSSACHKYYMPTIALLASDERLNACSACR